jgi:hypothetical protein
MADKNSNNLSLNSSSSSENDGAFDILEIEFDLEIGEDVPPISDELYAMLCYARREQLDWIA